jgi:predicted small lipoprotein YifL
MDCMRRLATFAPLLLVFLLSLTACGGSGVRERVFPPTASVQELALQADGRWLLKIRLQNFSNVPMRFDAVEATLKIGPANAGSVSLQPGLDVGPESAEIVELSLLPASAAANHVQAANARRGSVAYTLAGTIRSSEPDSRRDEFEFKSQLSHVPGLTGILR